MEGLNTAISEFIQKEHSDFRVASTDSQIKISKYSYFSIILKSRKDTVEITIYTGLLAFILNRNFKNRIADLKEDLERILLENNFKYTYLNKMNYD